MEFQFEAATKNGSVYTTFQECINVDGHISLGTVGSNLTVMVKIETNNGNIETNYMKSI